MTTEQLQPLKDNATEISEHICALFKGRDDRVGIGTSATIVSKEIDGELIATEIEDVHLSQQHCLAVYPLFDDGTVRFTCVDLDNKEHNPDELIEQKLSRLVKALIDMGLTPLVERSQSGSGYHIWLFFSEPVSASRVRAFWKGVCKQLGLAVPEIFPKQSTLKQGQVGNCVRLPLFNQSRFLEIEKGWIRERESLTALQEVKRITSQELTACAERAGLSLADESRYDAGNSEYESTGIPRRVASILANEQSRLRRRWDGDTTGMNDTSRSSIVCALAVELVKQFVPTAEIRRTLEIWCQTHNYEKGLQAGRLDRAIDSAYSFVAEKFRLVSR